MTWSMMCAGLIVGLPVFFEVGFVLLIPIAFTVARRTRTSLILVGLPLVAGLSVVHALVPPHPAAMLAVTIFHADVGRTILYGLLVGIPSAVIAGPIYARFIAPRIVLDAHNPMAEQFAEHDAHRSLARLWHLDGHYLAAGGADAAWQLGRSTGSARHGCQPGAALAGDC